MKIPYFVIRTKNGYVVGRNCVEETYDVDENATVDTALLFPTDIPYNEFCEIRDSVNGMGAEFIYVWREPHAQMITNRR